MALDIRQLYDEHAQALFAFVLNLTRCESETRDVLQEVFAKIAGKPASFHAAREMRAYLLRTAHRLVVDSWRCRAIHARAVEQITIEPPAFFEPTGGPDEAAFRAATEQALIGLPPDQRAVVHLKIWERMTFAEIATALDISINTAASRYRYGLDKMRLSLRPIYNELL